MWVRMVKICINLSSDTSFRFITIARTRWAWKGAKQKKKAMTTATKEDKTKVIETRLSRAILNCLIKLLGERTIDLPSTCKWNRCGTFLPNGARIHLRLPNRVQKPLGKNFRKQLLTEHPDNGSTRVILSSNGHWQRVPTFQALSRRWDSSFASAFDLSIAASWWGTQLYSN